MDKDLKLFFRKRRRGSDGELLVETIVGFKLAKNLKTPAVVKTYNADEVEAFNAQATKGMIDYPDGSYDWLVKYNTRNLFEKDEIGILITEVNVDCYLKKVKASKKHKVKAYNRLRLKIEEPTKLIKTPKEQITPGMLVTFRNGTQALAIQYRNGIMFKEDEGFMYLHGYKDDLTYGTANQRDPWDIVKVGIAYGYTKNIQDMEYTEVIWERPISIQTRKAMLRKELRHRLSKREIEGIIDNILAICGANND